MKSYIEPEFLGYNYDFDIWESPDLPIFLERYNDDYGKMNLNEIILYFNNNFQCHYEENGKSLQREFTEKEKQNDIHFTTSFFYYCDPINRQEQRMNITIQINDHWVYCEDSPNEREWNEKQLKKKQMNEEYKVIPFDETKTLSYILIEFKKKMSFKDFNLKFKCVLKQLVNLFYNKQIHNFMGKNININMNCIDNISNYL